MPNAGASADASPLAQEAYVWQRAWNQQVRDAVRQQGTNFSGLIALKVEVSWINQQPHVVRIPVAYSALREARCPVGLALRIGPYAGPFAAADHAAVLLADLAARIVTEAKTNHLVPSELQVDFDCAESKLEGYGLWIRTLRAKVSPVPVTITALPAWLRQTAFKQLASEADGYVLQVHSLERPRALNAPFSLCDPAAAQASVQRAAKLGVPFRVALPTYGYCIAFDRDGRFIGLSAEGPGRSWPEDARIREVRSNPVEIARLVQGWTTNRPTAMQGLLWYRLPVSDDILNWRWPTLHAIMAARSPRESFRAEPHRVESGLVEISLENDGELDISSRLAIEVRWQNARLVAGDGLGGFELADREPSAVEFKIKSQPWRLPAGEKKVIGWLRLNEDREVQLEVRRAKFDMQEKSETPK